MIGRWLLQSFLNVGMITHAKDVSHVRRLFAISSSEQEKRQRPKAPEAEDAVFRNRRQQWGHCKERSADKVACAPKMSAQSEQDDAADQTHDSIEICSIATG